MLNKVTNELPYTLVIPNKIPPSWNKWWSLKHWAIKKQMADEWHKIVWYAVLSAEERLMLTEKGVHITIRCYFPNQRMLDADNICAKIIIDGLVNSNVISNDSPDWVKKVTTEPLLDRANPRTEVELKWAE